jgi:hypothetical protein
MLQLRAARSLLLRMGKHCTWQVRQGQETSWQQLRQSRLQTSPVLSNSLKQETVLQQQQQHKAALGCHHGQHLHVQSTHQWQQQQQQQQLNQTQWCHICRLL